MRLTIHRHSAKPNPVTINGFIEKKYGEKSEDIHTCNRLVVERLVVDMMELIHACECDCCELVVPMMNAFPRLLVDSQRSHHISTYRHCIATQLALVSAAIDSKMKTMSGQYAMTEIFKDSFTGYSNYQHVIHIYCEKRNRQTKFTCCC